MLPANTVSLAFYLLFGSIPSVSTHGKRVCSRPMTC